MWLRIELTDDTPDWHRDGLRERRAPHLSGGLSMPHDVTRKLVMTINTSALEFSLSAIPVGEHNAASFQVQLISANGSLTTFQAGLQGSNDLLQLGKTSRGHPSRPRRRRR
ncbi:MAG: hypothetical protein R3F43_19680 [bacterium]